MHCRKRKKKKKDNFILEMCAALRYVGVASLKPQHELLLSRFVAHSLVMSISMPL